MKSSTKRKPEEANKKKKQQSTSSAPKVNTLSESDLSVMAAWNSEVESLMQTEFQDLDEAIHALIDKVVSRMEPGGDDAHKQKTKEFIYEFLTGDPDIEKELKSILNLK